MESIQDDPMAQAVLGAIKKGPRTQSQIHGLFLRNRNAAEINGVLARLRHAKQITRVTEPTGGRPKTVWRLRDKVNDEKTTQAPGKRRIFCSLRFPSLVIGNRVKFEDGFFVTDDPQKIQLIEQSGEFGLTIQDITDVLRGMPLSKLKKIYLSSQPSVEIEHHPRLKAVEFETVADGLYLFVSENPELASFIEHSQLFRSEQVREVPRTLMEVA